MRTLLLVTLMFVAQVVLAQPALDQLRASYPGLEVSNATPAPVGGWLEVVTGDGQILYVSDDGRHAMLGDLVDVSARTNLTDLTRKSARATLLADFEPTFRFPAAEPVADVTVITDIDCPYCRRLHQQIDAYNERGISVNYLMLPRAGRGSTSWHKASAAACAQDPEAALTAAMNGRDPEPAQCENRIDEEFELARSLRSTGTPAIVTADGRLFDGFMSPDELAQRLD